MLTKRIISCLDVRDGSVVKGVKFEQLRLAGDPAELAKRYNQEGIDEIVILDVTATLEGRRALVNTVRTVAQEIFLPLAVGGGIRSEADAAAVVNAGADKISINTAALTNPSLITRLSTRYGSQAVIVAIDAKREGNHFTVYARSGQTAANRNAIEWAQEAADRGAGEILLTVSTAVPIPVIASGGAGTFDHFVDVFTKGKGDAALAASIFHYAEHSVTELKGYLAKHRISIRF